MVLVNKKVISFYQTYLVFRSERIQSLGADKSLVFGPQPDLFIGTRSHELAVGRSGSQGLWHYLNNKRKNTIKAKVYIIAIKNKQPYKEK